MLKKFQSCIFLSVLRLNFYDLMQNSSHMETKWRQAFGLSRPSDPAEWIPTRKASIGLQSILVHYPAMMFRLRKSISPIRPEDIPTRSAKSCDTPRAKDSSSECRLCPDEANRALPSFYNAPFYQRSSTPNSTGAERSCACATGKNTRPIL